MKLSKLVGSPRIGLYRRGSLVGSPVSGVFRRGGLSQLLLVSAISLAVATLLSACQLITIDFVYLAGDGPSGSGQIASFAADSQSGALRPGRKSVDSGGSSPSALAASGDHFHLGQKCREQFGAHFRPILKMRDTSILFTMNKRIFFAWREWASQAPRPPSGSRTARFPRFP